MLIIWTCISVQRLQVGILDKWCIRSTHYHYSNHLRYILYKQIHNFTFILDIFQYTFIASAFYFIHRQIQIEVLFTHIFVLHLSVQKNDIGCRVVHKLFFFPCKCTSCPCVVPHLFMSMSGLGVTCERRAVLCDPSCVLNIKCTNVFQSSTLHSERALLFSTTTLYLIQMIRANKSEREYEGIEIHVS